MNLRNAEDKFDLQTLLTSTIHKQDRRSQDKDLCEVREFDGVGAEKFASTPLTMQTVNQKQQMTCYVVSVECMEHGANSAIYSR